MRSVLKARRSLGVAPPLGWLDSVARAIRDALAAGAKQETDLDGWFYLTTPNGQRLVVAPDTLAQIVEAGLLLPLPQPGVVETQA